MARSRITVLLGIAGLVVICVYLASALGVIRDVNNFTLSLVFAIGPVAIFGVVEISRRLATQHELPTVKLGQVFLVIAFALFTLMLVVQQTVVIRYRQLVTEAADSAHVETLRVAFSLVNQVQLGIDVCFDIFYCVGVVLLSVAMFQHRDFGKFVGVFGVASATALLAFNLATFPGVPAESGLLDLGPLTGVWWILVIVLMIRGAMRQRTSRTDNPSPRAL